MSDGRNRVAELEAQLQDARTEIEQLRDHIQALAIMSIDFIENVARVANETKDGKPD